MRKKVAIIDYELGNLFSVQQACDYVGLNGVITSDKVEIRNADALILPGVGAFGSAMQKLSELDIVDELKDFSNSGRPFLGICLGMQLLFTKSSEYGNNEGLNIIPGNIKRFNQEKIKIPQIQWNSIKRIDGDSWNNTILDGVPNEAFMYFVHSYYCKPFDQERILAKTTYGSTSYSSVVVNKNNIGIQFHPEKSSHYGLKIYENFSKMI